MASLTSKESLLKWYDKNFCIDAISFDWRLFAFAKVHSESFHLRALEIILKSRLMKLRATRVRKLSGSVRPKTSNEELFTAALEFLPDDLSHHKGDDLPLLKVMKLPTRKVMLEVLKEFPLNLRYVANPDRSMILTAVTRNGHALAYVEDQDDEICKAAVGSHPLALNHVKHQREDICRLAIEQDPRAFFYVKQPTVEILKFAVRLSTNTLFFIDIKQFPEILEYCKLLKY